MSSADIVLQNLLVDARIFAANSQAAADNSLTAAMNSLSGGLPVGPKEKEMPTLVVTPPVPYVPGVLPEFTGTPFEADAFDGTMDALSDVPDFVEPAGFSSLAIPEIADYVPPTEPSFTPDGALLMNVPTVSDEYGAPPTPDLMAEIKGIAVPELIDVTIPVAPPREEFPIPAAPPRVYLSVPSAPEELSLIIPTAPPAPDITVPPVPAALEMTIPDPPEYVEPQFTGTPPVFTAVMPTGLDERMRAEYLGVSPIMRDAATVALDTFLDREFPNYRAGMATLEARLATYLAGGTALSADVENAIFARTVDKTDTEARRAAQESWGKAARAGFTIPTAILLAQQGDIDQARRDNNVRAAIDIAIKQAELEQNNLQFAVTQSAGLRKVAIDASVAYYTGLVTINGQAVEYARSVVDSIVKAYDLATKQAETQARIYEAEARIYESKQKGAIAVFDAYTAQMKGYETRASVYLAQIKGFEAEVDATVKAPVAIFDAEIKGFEAEIKGVGAEVALQDARVRGFEAEIKGLDAQATAQAVVSKNYEAELRGVDAQVNVYEAHSKNYEAGLRAVEAQATIYNSDVNAYRARLEAVQSEASVYRSAVEAANGKAQLERLKIELYQARVQAYVSQVNALTAEWQGFSAASQGRMAPVQASVERVRAYSAAASAHEAAIRGVTAEIDAVGRSNEAKAQSFSAEASAYNSYVQAKASFARAEIESFDLTLKTALADIEAGQAGRRSEITHYEIGLRGLLNAVQLYLEHERINSEYNKTRMQAIAQMAVGGSQVYAGVAQAALSGMNTLASVALTESV
jgi:competence protein ComGC